MAPTTPGNSRHRQRELRVAKNSEGAQAQGGPLSNNTDRNSIDVTVDTLSGDTTAKLRQTVMRLAEKVMLIEERSTFLGDLLKIKRGTREVEAFFKKQDNIRHELKENMDREDVVGMIEKEREAITATMENKLTDNILKVARKGR